MKMSDLRVKIDARHTHLYSDLIQAGVVSEAQLEAFVPTAESAARAKAERDAFVNRIYGAFARATVKATPDP